MQGCISDLATGNSAISALARRLERLLKRDQFTIDDRDGSEINALERAISELPAADLTEVAIQLMLASAYIERREEDLVEDPEEYLRGLNRLIRSALAALLRETGIDLSDFGGQRYVPAHTDPFRGEFPMH